MTYAGALCVVMSSRAAEVTGAYRVRSHSCDDDVMHKVLCEMDSEFKIVH